MWVFFLQTHSGKIYARDFFGHFHATGNNYYTNILGGENLSNNSFLIYPTNNNNLWVFDGQYMLVFNHDTLVGKYSSPPHKFKLSNFNAVGKAIYLLTPVQDSMKIYKFNHNHWMMMNTILWKNKKIIDGNYAPKKLNNLYLLTQESNYKHGVYLLDTIQYQLQYINSVPQKDSFQYPILYNTQWIKNSTLEKSFELFIKARTGKPITDQSRGFIWNTEHFLPINDSMAIFFHANGMKEILQYDSTGIKPQTILLDTKEKINSFHYNPYYPYFTGYTGNKSIRVFPYIRKYPRIYNNENSLNIFTVVQDDFGRIWAGSYLNELSILSPSINNKQPFINNKTNFSNTDSFKNTDAFRLHNLKKQPYPFMNAALNYNGKLYFIGETSKGGLLQYDMQGNMKKILPQLQTGFYLYLAPKGKKVYYATAFVPNYPVYYCNVEALEHPPIQWKKLDLEAGISGFGMASITEDTLGRIWMGHPKKGFAVYNPHTQKGITYDTREGKSPIGFISSLTDNKGTVWMGSDDKGLWYYNNYSKPATAQNIHQLSHPLLNNVKRITAMSIYKNWLVLACYNKICLLNLDSFHLKNKSIVRYLNPQEASFTSFTEQNTLLASKTNGLVWFSTSDNLYQWDIQNWLQLPFYKVAVTTILQHDNLSHELQLDKPFYLDAGTKNFSIELRYLSPDGLPRYSRATLVKLGDSLVYDEPAVQRFYNFKNLSSGQYRFYAEIFEQDGSITSYLYPFVISKFIWQQWWFWVIISCTLILPILLWLNALRKQALQQKHISQLNIITLSNQFRPHFILNALNTIGADLKDKPAAETIISRLGESINLIFDHTRQKKVTHTLEYEWQLVLNVIEIHQIMYLPLLEKELPEKHWLQQQGSVRVPMGILEIIVENALLHGLRNRKQEPYQLKISEKDDADFLFFAIEDNGIGRAAAMQLTSYKKHGTGTKNLNEIINILNKSNRKKIKILFEDSIDNNQNKTGTSVIIIIPKNYHYEY